jgi:hypothetical protein
LRVGEIAEGEIDSTPLFRAVTYILEYVMPILWTVDDSSDNSDIKQALESLQIELAGRPETVEQQVWSTTVGGW